jgi:Fe-S-cluster containining protein
LTRVVRPIVRSFTAPHAGACARHVRAGGHAVLWQTTRKARLVLPVPDEDDVMDLAYWSLLDLGKSDWTVEKRGVLKGLATASVPRDCFEIVKRRAERDSVHPGTHRTVRFDCLRCGACCRANRVEIDDEDVARFEEAGRLDLIRPPYAKKDKGKIVLRLLKSKRCRHLGGDNKCGIYKLRPNACSQFPVGSECCLSAREEELGLTDGLPPS